LPIGLDPKLPDQGGRYAIQTNLENNLASQGARPWPDRKKALIAMSALPPKADMAHDGDGIVDSNISVVNSRMERA
jgi:hypothetical protein